jgi:GTPase
MDLYRQRYYDELLDAQTKHEIEMEFEENIRNKYGQNSVFISATEKDNIEGLRDVMMNMIKEQYVIRYPHQAKQW